MGSLRVARLRGFTIALPQKRETARVDVAMKVLLDVGVRQM